MNKLLFGLILVLFAQFFGALSLFNNELNLHLSTKDSSNFLTLLRKLLQSKNSNVDLIVDVKIKDREQPNHHQQYHNPRCRACIETAKFYEKQFDHSKSAETIVKIFNGTCDILKTPRRQRCVRFYQTIGSQAIKDLYNGVNPTKICQYLKMCRHVRSESEFDDVIYDIRMLARDHSAVYHNCHHCILVTRNLELMIDSSKSLTFVIGKFMSICTVYKTEMQVKCENYFKKKSSVQYFKSILAHKCPYKICQAREDCKKKKELALTEHHGVTVSKEKSSNYKLCRQMIIVLDKMIKNQQAMDQISIILRDVCHMLPKVYQPLCQSFEKSKFDKNLKDLFQGLKHEQICTDIDQRKVNMAETKSIECWICKEVMKILEHMINKKSSRDEIEKALNKLCSHLPGLFRHSCSNFVHKYNQQIIDLIIHGIPFDRICSVLQVCSIKGISLRNNLL